MAGAVINQFIIKDPVPDSQFVNRLFLRIIAGALALSLVVAIGYLLWGGQIVKFVYDGGKIAGIITIDHNPNTSLEQYTRESAARIWGNVVLGIPLSLLIIFLIYKFYTSLMGLKGGETEFRTDSGPPTVTGAVIAGSLYTLLTILFYYPSFATFGHAMIGAPEDNMACLWTLSYAKAHIFHGGQGLSFVRDICYPEGAATYFHAWSFYCVLLFSGLTQLFGAVTSYNLLILHGFPLAGIGGYLFARYLLKNHWLALLAGFLFAFNPAHFERAQHHLNIATIQFLPLFALYFIKALRKESHWAILWAALFFLLNTMVDWNYGIYCIWFMFFCYLYLAVKRRQWVLGDVLTKSALVGAVTVVILSPWLIPMTGLAVANTGADAGGHNKFVIDVMGILIPNPMHLLGGLNVVKEINQSYTGWSWENTGYLGIAALLLVGLTLKRVLTEIAALLLGMVSFLLMSFGAQPHFFGMFVPAIVPGRILPILPILSNSRAPSRNMVFVYLFWSVIVAVALRELWNRLRRPGFRVVVVGFLSVILVADYSARFGQMTPVDLPPCYSVMPFTGERYGILDLPSGYVPVERYMMYQSLHGIPIVQGWISRKLERTLIDRLELNDLLIQKQQLTDARVKYVVLHKMYLPAPDLNPPAYDRTYVKVFDDPQNAVYQVY